VLAIIKAQLSPPGLAGAAFGFDSAAMVREMQVAADELVEGFIEMQAQSLSWEVTRRMQATDWMLSAAPREVADLIEIILGELRATQMLAAQARVLRFEPCRSDPPFQFGSHSKGCMGALTRRILKTVQTPHFSSEAIASFAWER